jgi:N-acetylmuramoyl-L-alanine amidase
VRRARRLLLSALAPVLAAVACGVAPAAAPPVPRTTGSAAPAPEGSTAATGSPGPAVPPPAPAPAAPPPAPPGDRPRVVLDAGHNGRNGENPDAIARPVPDGRGGTKACNTTGTATDAGYPEHAFTFDVTARVAQRLVEADVDVVLVRADDDGVGPCVDVRGRAGETADADAVVSVHADGAAPGAGGFHVALSEPPLNPAQEGPARALGTALRDALRAGGFRDSDYTGRDGLSARSDLAGLNHATRPTALVECGNMRNPEEAALMSTPEGRQRYADAIAAGVLAFLGR